ncbi:hypothetical protein FBU59_002538 [Linderina macrospora]|uniref:Uncharacterized protein n=1 Tax=Linderina macrospora TaxID=4868 RepID=A0ACC1JB10_9FUNG|nr:hypothetical protein FBU59_002538 [Linderina macrospora]
MSRRFHSTDILLLILALFFPPLTAFFKRGFGTDLLINLLLTILGFLPGLLHAWYLVFEHPYETRGYVEIRG